MAQLDFGDRAFLQTDGALLRKDRAFLQKFRALLQRDRALLRKDMSIHSQNQSSVPLFILSQALAFDLEGRHWCADRDSPLHLPEEG